MIYTFYSYKGGVGRSMALANLATLFYQEGLRVLMVDWDLEAPGLESYFLRRFGHQAATLCHHDGLIDFLQEYKNRLLPNTTLLEEEEEPAFEFPDLGDYYQKIASEKGKGELTLLAAGNRIDPTTYARNVLRFDWDEFYDQWEGEVLFEWVRQQWEKMFDIVLIDSRTGETEMTGICTIHLADVVTLFTAPNTQNLEGTHKIMHRFAAAENHPIRRGRALRLVVIPARVDVTEIEAYNQFREQIQTLFDQTPNFQSILQIVQQHQLGNPSDRNSLLALKLPYLPSYAYHERLAVGRKLELTESTELTDAYRSIHLVLKSLASPSHILHLYSHKLPQPQDPFDTFAWQKISEDSRAADLGDVKHLFESLAVFPEDALIPVETIGRYWTATSGDGRYSPNHLADKNIPTSLPNQLHLLCQLFHEKGIFTEYDQAQRLIKLAPYTTPYLQTHQSTNNHQRLLKVYGLETPLSAAKIQAKMDSFDTYLWHNLIFHLKQIGADTTIAQLVRNLTYLTLKLLHCPTHRLEQDLLMAAQIDPNITQLHRQLARLTHLLTPSALDALGQPLGTEERLNIIKNLLNLHLWPHLTTTTSTPNEFTLTPSQRIDLTPALTRVLCPNPTDILYTAVATPDGRYCLAGTANGALILWENQTGREINRWTEHSERITTAAISPNAQLLATGGLFDGLKTWDISQLPHKLIRVSYNDNPIVSCQFHPQNPNQLLITTDETEPQAKLLTLPQLTPQQTMSGHGQATLVPPDYTQIITVVGSQISLWDITTTPPKLLHQFTGGSAAQIHCCAISPNGRWLATGSQNHQLTLWDLTNRTLVHEFDAQAGSHLAPITHCLFTEDNQYLLSVGQDINGRLWNITNKQLVAYLAGHTAHITNLTRTSQPHQFLTTSADKTARLWDIEILSQAPPPTHGRIWSLGFLPHQDQFFTAATSDPNLNIWDYHTNQPLRQLGGHLGHQLGLFDAQIAPTGDWMVTTGIDKRLIIWDMATQQPKYILNHHQGELITCDISPDGRYIASTDENRQICLWEASTGHLHHQWVAHASRISRLAFSPNGRQLATFSHDKTCQIWDWASQTSQLTLKGHESFVIDGTFHPEGYELLTVGSDKIIRIWNLATGQERLTLRGHNDSCWYAWYFGPQNETIGSISNDGTLRIWNATTGQLQHTAYIDETLTGVAIHPQNPTTLLLAGTQGIYKLHLHVPSKENQTADDLIKNIRYK